MTIVDTNVISEATRPQPSEIVARWMRHYPVGELFTTSITEAEILLGIEIMPAGSRREAVKAAVNGILSRVFAGRILPFDSDAAGFYAQIAASRRRLGRPIGQSDAQIAAIARAHGRALATRDIDDFRDRGLALTNPWAA